MKRISRNECAAFLRENDNYLIISHRRPDGDTLGSTAALCSALRRMGKRAFVLRNPGTTSKFKPFVEKFFTPEGFRYDGETVVSCDVASLSQFFDGAPENAALSIDHHPSNTGFADRLLLEGERASCGEIVMGVIELVCGSLSKEEAELIYIALSTDCGCFQYGNTDAEAFEAAAKLVRCGADAPALNRVFFRTFSRAHIAVEGALMASLRYYFDGKFTAAVLTKSMVEAAQATEDDMDDLAGLPGKVAGTLCSALVKENPDGSSKVSLRSVGTVDVSEVCAVWGGGGHKMAAGCEIKLSPSDAVEALRQEIGKRL